MGWLSAQPDRIAIDDLLDALNRALSTSFRLLGRYAGGEQGAFELLAPDGMHLVLKTYAPTAYAQLLYTQASTARLRAVGYPAPHYQHIGHFDPWVYSLQAALPGIPVPRMTLPLVRELQALNRLQAGRALPGPHTWPAQLIEVADVGGPGFCLLVPMRDYSAATAALLAEVQAIARQEVARSTPQDDIVHFDCTPANLLSVAGALSGVIDWDGVCAGDRAFDLATMLFYTYEEPIIRTALWAMLRALATPAVTTLYLAHLAHRQVDWSIRNHDAAMVARWLRVAQMALAASRHG